MSRPGGRMVWRPPDGAVGVKVDDESCGPVGGDGRWLSDVKRWAWSG